MVIDTDMGADDWMAILYLLQRPDVHVRAITVSGAGLAHCGAGVRNALRLLALTGKRAPVACGRARPRHFPADWRRSADRMLGFRLPGAAGSPSPKPASELLAAAVRGSVRPVSLLTLGPLTNVADAFALDPRLARELRAVYVMGGAITAPGNTPDGASDGTSTSTRRRRQRSCARARRSRSCRSTRRSTSRSPARSMKG